MSSDGLNDFLDDCFVEKDPICDLRRQDSLELDRYASVLIAEMMLSSGTATSWTRWVVSMFCLRRMNVSWVKILIDLAIWTWRMHLV